VGLVNKVGMVIHPVDDLDAAARFYGEVLGLTEKFRDGDRFAAFDAGGVTIALAAGDEARVVGGVTGVNYKVDDVAAAVAALVAGGASVVHDAEEGPHEIRATLRDPAGNTFGVYGPKPA
jgi:predicted enzyme related to lactoylglutathione lyase